MLALLLLLGCTAAPSPAEDAAEYAAILASDGRDPRADLDRCARLGDETLRGDCAAAVAGRAARALGDAPRWCAEVPEGAWRDECMFQAAEQALVAAGPARASGLCQQAGAFAEDCMVHVWRPQLGRLVDGMSANAFAARYTAADELYRQTAAQAGASGALERTFWLAFFGSGFRASGQVDTTRCAGLGAEGTRRCEDAAALLLTEPLEGLLRARGQLEAFCGRSPPRSADVAPMLGVAPSEALDRALASEQPMICGGAGQGLPTHGGGLRVQATGAR